VLAEGVPAEVRRVHRARRRVELREKFVDVGNRLSAGRRRGQGRRASNAPYSTAMPITRIARAASACNAHSDAAALNCHIPPENAWSTMPPGFRPLDHHGVKRHRTEGAPQ
jgi:hypothetical protein